MTKKTKNTLLIAGGVLVGLIIIRNLRAKGSMISDSEDTGLLGLGLFGIL